MEDLKDTLKLPKDDPRHPYNIIAHIKKDQIAMAQRIDNQAVTLNQLLDAVNRHFANPFATIGSVNIQLRAPTDDQATAGQTIGINVVPSGVESESENLARELEEVRQALRDKEEELAAKNARLASLAGKNDKVAEYESRLKVVEMQRQLNEKDTVLAMKENRITDLEGLQQQNTQTAPVSHGTAAPPLTDDQPRPPPQAPDVNPTVEGQSKPSPQAYAEPPAEDQPRSRPQDSATEPPAKDQPQPQRQAPAAQPPAKSQPNPAPQAPAAKPPGQPRKGYRGEGAFTPRSGASVLSKGGGRKKELPVQSETESSSESENPENYQPGYDAALARPCTYRRPAGREHALGTLAQRPRLGLSNDGCPAVLSTASVCTVHSVTYHLFNIFNIRYLSEKCMPQFLHVSPWLCSLSERNADEPVCLNGYLSLERNPSQVSE